VIGHEVAHVVAQHANARVSSAYAAEAGLALANVLAGAASPQKQQLLALLGLGAQVGVLLPYGRAQESEADLLGLDLMAHAGFDPRESVQLWKNMARAGGGQPPEFLSTHPSGRTRINDLNSRMPHALSLYEQARAQGKSPDCS
jgi:predicted Zn-dependent protease